MTTNHLSNKRWIAVESATLALAAACFLLLFRQVLPHGDAARIVRQIQFGELSWNPNHLLLDPLGYGVVTAARSLFADVEPLACFVLISVAASVISLVIFHSILVRIGISRFGRIAVLFGFFGCAVVLGFSASQYYVIVQMPFLLGALWLLVESRDSDIYQGISAGHYYGAGALLAVAAAFMFNNVLILLACGIGVALSKSGAQRTGYFNAIRLYVGGAVVGFPVFVAGWFLSGSDANLISWVLAYEGVPDSQLLELYGLKWSLVGAAEAIARTGFNLVLGVMIETAGLGTVLWVVVSGQQFEFIPKWSNIALGLVAIPAAVAFSSWALIRILVLGRNDPTMRVLAAWVFGVVGFNFLWDSHDPSFWMPVAPVLWVGLVYDVSRWRARSQEKTGAGGGSGAEPLYLGAMGGFAMLAFVVNTLNILIPQADKEFENKRAAHEEMLKSGDLQVIPGWDQQRWMALSGRAPSIDRIVLMNAALGYGNESGDMSNLSRMVEDRIRSGRRVIVARLYDLDTDIMPWYSLARLGWPRQEIQELLETFCNREIARIDGVVFREVYECQPE